MIRGLKGPSVALPNKKGRKGLCRDVGHLLPIAPRKTIEDQVVEKFERSVSPEDLAAVTALAG